MLRYAPPVLIALAMLSAAEAQQQPQAPPPVTVATPVTKTVVEDDEFVGRFEAKAEVQVRSRVSGYLETVHFIDGQIVEEGDRLFTIDRRQFRIALEQSAAQVRVAEATYAFAKEQLDRAEALLTSGNIAVATVDARRETFLSASGSLEQARSTMQSAQIDLDYSEIHAPMSGRIDRAQVDPGNLVSADQTVLTSIVATDPIYFVFDIDERYFLAYARDARERGISLNQGGGIEAMITLLDETLGPYPAQMDFSENRIDAETGTMRVRAVLDNPDGVLTPGLFGRANVVGSLPYEAVLIPDAAVVADQNRRLVMLVDEDGKVTSRVVRPGPRIDGYRVIRDGLDGSETIVIMGLARARDGAVVTPERVDLPPSAEIPAAGN